MLKYFWEDCAYLWTEDSFDSLLKLLLRRDSCDYVSFLFRSRTTHSLFLSMSYAYRFKFLEHILANKNDFLDEIKHAALLQD